MSLDWVAEYLLGAPWFIESATPYTPVVPAWADRLGLRPRYWGEWNRR